MNPLDMGVQVPSLGEGGWAEHAEVRLLASVSCHVGLQHHLLVEGLAAVCALEGPLSCRRHGGKVRERQRGKVKTSRTSHWKFKCSLQNSSYQLSSACRTRAVSCSS